MWASTHDQQRNAVTLLLKAGANVHAKDAAGWTALTWASDCANAPAVTKLLGAGAALSELGYLSLTRPKSYHLRTKT